MRHNGGRREDCVGGGGEGGGEGGGGDGGGDEEPSKLRAEKVGWCGLSTLVTWRLPDSEVGDGRWWRFLKLVWQEVGSRFNTNFQF